MTLIVGLSGVAQVGKDTAADALVRQLGFTKRPYAAALVDGARAINPVVGMKDNGGYWRLAEVLDTYGYEGSKAKFPLVREFLQRYGTEGGRDVFGQDCWVNLLFDWAEANDVERLVIPDVRYENEIAAIEAESGLVFRVTRPNVRPVNGHLSDNALTDDDFDPSMLLVNNKEMTDLQRLIVRRVSEAFEL